MSAITVQQSPFLSRAWSDARSLRDYRTQHSSSDYPAQPGPGYQCFQPRPSPFANITGFDEDKITVHGGTIVSIEAGFLTKPQVRDSLGKMRANVKAAGGNMTIGLNNWPPYPCGVGAFGSKAEGKLCAHSSPLGDNTVGYQNACDWTWFGGRLVQALVAQDMVADALLVLQPMVDRICEHRTPPPPPPPPSQTARPSSSRGQPVVEPGCCGFYEYYLPSGEASGSPNFHGAAGVIGKAIEMLDAALAEARAA